MPARPSTSSPANSPTPRPTSSCAPAASARTPAARGRDPGSDDPLERAPRPHRGRGRGPTRRVGRVRGTTTRCTRHRPDPHPARLRSPPSPAVRERGADPTPVTAAEFADLMAPLGPFEARSRLAVAVSGGRDSLALALLAAGWCRSVGGEVVGLTVDHRLRPGSGAEARQVGRWLAAAGIAHHILVRRDELAAGSRQAAARAARYALLGDWCRRQGVLHLLVAHQQEDQAETLLLRLGRGSGLEGLAAMPAVV